MGYSYVDDRVLLTRAHGIFQQLKQAVSRSATFDAAFGLEVSTSKWAVIADSTSREAAALAGELQHKHTQDLRFQSTRSGA